MNDWNDLKAEKFSEGRACEVFRDGKECGAVAIDLDHAIFSGKQKNAKVRVEERRWLNKIYNAQRACDSCNRWAKRADRYKAIVHHIRREIERDSEGFTDWYYSAPEGISRKPGSRWKEYQLVVERGRDE